MAGEMVAFRRAALGAPTAEYARLVDRARVNKGGRGTSNESSASATTSISGTAVAASATPHTKGSYVEMIAASAFVAECIELTFTGTSIFQASADTSALLDIAFGAAASEVVQIANIAVGFTVAPRTLRLPYRVPSGTRVSVSLQCATGSKAPTIALMLWQAGDHSAPPTVATTYNANTATSNATTVMTVPGAINTESAWTEIVAATTADITRFFPGISGPVVTTMVAANSLVDFAVGGAGSEVAFLSNIGLITTTAESTTVIGGNTAHTVSIPAGSRISARYQSDSVSTSNRPNVIPIGFG